MVVSMRELRMGRRVYEAIRAHGEESYPNECCGALVGTFDEGSWRVSAAVRAGNASGEAARHRYRITPEELVRIQSEAHGQGLEIAGFYHSHPDHAPHWSAVDLAEAHWVGCAYVITGVESGSAAETKAFLLAGTKEEDKRFEELSLATDG